MTWFKQPVHNIDQSSVDFAKERQNTLTKPPGSLGMLEEVAIRLSGMMGKAPNPDQPAITVFAGDHGVAAENVSAFPQVVTGEMVRNFASGGAAICVLSKAANATLEVVNLGTVNNPGELSGVVQAVIAEQTQNLAMGPAMSQDQLEQGMQQGQAAIERAVRSGKNIFVGGDMGIANTTAATALICAYLHKPAAEIAGPGTGLDAKGVAHKAKIIDDALALHQCTEKSPEEVLRRLGGFEIAALAGAYIAAAQKGMPVVIDGFITSAAALAACRINPHCGKWMLLSHVSAEPGYAAVQAALMEATGSAPLINFNLRLGEGSGAATVLPLIQNACRLHNEMATFAEAGVSEG